jgi:putative membrane protein
MASSRPGPAKFTLHSIAPRRRRARKTRLAKAKARAYDALMSDKTEKAEQRTDWAEDRTMMANERTFNSWMGLGLGAVGVAIALKAVFGEFEPTWAAKAVASLFLIAAIVIYWSAAQQAHKTHRRLTSRDAAALETKDFRRLAALLTLATLGTGAVLWML